MIARVLVVDDDAAILRALSSVLTRAGFDVTTLDDGAPAIALPGAGHLSATSYSTDPPFTDPFFQLLWFAIVDVCDCIYSHVF